MSLINQRKEKRMKNKTLITLAILGLFGTASLLADSNKTTITNKTEKTIKISALR